MTNIKFSSSWILHKNCDWVEQENDLDDFCGELDEEHENNSDPTEQLLKKFMMEKDS